MEGSTRIDPLYDAMFLRVFGSPGSGPMTGALVNLVLQAVGEGPIEGLDITGADTAVVEGSARGKTPRLDVVLSAPGHLVDLEAQRQTGATLERMMFYAARLQTSHMRRGMAYSELPRVAVIALMGTSDPLVPGDDVMGCCRYCWDSTGEPIAAADRSLLIGVDLAKVRKRYTALTEEVLADELSAWLYLLARGYEDEGEVDAMAERFPTIEEFAQRYGVASDDPWLAVEYENYTLAEQDRATFEWDRQRRLDEAAAQGLKQGIEQGIEQGMAQGLEQGMAQGLEQGLAQGLEQGMAQGLEQGLAQGAERERDLVRARMKELEIDPALIEQVLRAERHDVA